MKSYWEGAIDMGIELLKGMLGILPKVFQQFFSCRKRKEVLMQELMNKDYFAALIMTLRKIHAKCSRLDVTTSREELLSIANIVVNELSPTAAQAGGYNHESVIKEFGSEMHGKLEKLLNVCADIDCLTAPGADIPISKNQILPACLNAQMIWNEIVELYIQKVCLFGRFGKARQKTILECRIEKAVPRAFPLSY